MNNISTQLVILAGTIASEPKFNHEVYGEKFYLVTVSSTRTSGAKDELPVVISERMVNMDELQVGRTIVVNGQIRTFNNRSNDSEKAKLIITVFAQELELDINESDLNDVKLSGYVCKPPVYRTTPLGRDICDLLLAVNRAYGKSDYIPVIVWGRNAKYAGRLEVGCKLDVYGRLQSRIFHKKINEAGDTEERVAYEVSASKLETVE